jgi:hypothetical protein
MTYIGENNITWLGDERITTYDSGLIAAQRTAVVRRNSFLTPPSLGDKLPLTKDPSLEGCFVYPEPAESRDPAFIYYAVTAYGRTNEHGITRKIETASATGMYLLPRVVRNFVVRNDATVNPWAYAPTDPWTLQTIYGTFENVPVAFALETFERTPYGRFDEVVISWKTRMQ